MVPEDKNKNKVVESEIYNRFSTIVKEKFTSIGSDGSQINQLDELYKRPEFAAEKRILNEMNSIGLSKGILSGLACFAFLRTSPRFISNYLRRRAGSSGADVNSGAPNPFQQQATSSGYKFDQNVEQRPGIVFRGVRLLLDSFVSLSIGAYASMFFTDTNKMMQKFSTIPLVEGRSLLSEQLCGDFTQEFRNYDRQIWNSRHPSLTGGDVSRSEDIEGFRDLIQGFVANCQRREIYEKEIRAEQGLNAEDPVIIPSPGVPQDISVTLEDLLSTKESGDKEDRDTDGGDEFFDTYFDSTDEGDFKD